MASAAISGIRMRINGLFGNLASLGGARPDDLRADGRHSHANAHYRNYAAYGRSDAAPPWRRRNGWLYPNHVAIHRMSGRRGADVYRLLVPLAASAWRIAGLSGKGSPPSGACSRTASMSGSRSVKRQRPSGHRTRVSR